MIYLILIAVEQMKVKQCRTGRRLDGYFPECSEVEGKIQSKKYNLFGNCHIIIGGRIDTLKNFTRNLSKDNSRN